MVCGSNMITNKYLKLSFFFKYTLGLIFLFFIVGYTTVLVACIKNRHLETDNLQLKTVEGKMNHFKVNADKYDILLYGDSRTYLGINASMITNETGYKTFNYASMSHWFETQYLQLKKIGKALQNRNIIWVIGEINFTEPAGKDKVQNHMTIGLQDFFKYLTWGYSVHDIYDNFLLNILPSRHLFFLENTIKIRFQNFLEKEVSSLNEINIKDNSNSCTINSENFFNSTKQYGKEGNLVGCFYFKNDGQLLFEEKDSKYLRARQSELSSKINHELPYEISSKNEKLFEEILKIFKKNNVNLFVLEYKDTPYNYKEGSIRTNSIEQYMNKVEEQVESFGFRYIEVDFSKFQESDYFDYNHLNSKGSKKFTKKIIEIIKANSNAI